MFFAFLSLHLPFSSFFLQVRSFLPFNCVGSEREEIKGRQRGNKDIEVFVLSLPHPSDPWRTERKEEGGKIRKKNSPRRKEDSLLLLLLLPSYFSSLIVQWRGKRRKKKRPFLPSTAPQKMKKEERTAIGR